jgi:dinuclear metal center YbgI/SA1388 family protein
VPTCPTLDDVVAVIESLYPPRFAQPDDAGIGLIVGEPAAEVRRVLLAVDPVQAVVDEAVDVGADLLLVHHPLLFRAVNSVAAHGPKGRVVHDLVSHGIGLYAAHTNADSARRGVSESMTLALGLTNVRPLQADPAEPLDKVVTFVPADAADKLVDALAEAGAGHVGAYDRCAFLTDGDGTFRPGASANPTIGTVGAIEVVRERRIEMVLPRALRGDVVAALRRAHPYEEPAFDILELASWDSGRGTGRVGELAEPMALRAFADRVATVLPPTAAGVRVAGELGAIVRTVAVVGGAGDFMLDEVRRQHVDVYVTSDLRHHPASEFREHTGAPALVDVPHWSAEWAWLPVAADAVRSAVAERAAEIETSVSRICTDPWNHHVVTSRHPTEESLR